jgi:hypothetical protein
MILKRILLYNKMNYKCKRCMYTTKYFSDIKRHLTKKKTCSRNLNAYDYLDEELFKLSLIPYYNDKQDIDISIIKNKNKNILNKCEMIELLSNIDKKKIKICNFCNKNFDKIQDLKTHIILYCVSIIENSDENNLTINNTIHHNTVNNTINTINNININLNIDPIISFDKDWDISHLGTAEKQSLFTSMYKYTKTLEHILKNETNLNVLIDKNSDTGFVYNNNSIQQMSIDEIIDKSFNKIYNNLNDIYNDIQSNNYFGISNDLLNIHKNSIKEKFDCFYENENTRKIVKTHISETLDKVKDKTKENFNQLDINYLGDISEGY